MDFTTLPVWMQDLIPMMVWVTMAGVFLLTVWTLIAKVLRTMRKDKSGLD